MSADEIAQEQKRWQDMSWMVKQSVKAKIRPNPAAAARLERWRKIFDFIDEDRDGVITALQIKKAFSLRRQRPLPMETQFQQIQAHQATEPRHKVLFDSVRDEFGLDELAKKKEEGEGGGGEGGGEGDEKKEEEGGEGEAAEENKEEGDAGASDSSGDEGGGGSKKKKKVSLSLSVLICGFTLPSPSPSSPPPPPPRTCSCCCLVSLALVAIALM